MIRLYARRKWNNNFKISRKEKWAPTTLYLAKLTFKKRGAQIVVNMQQIRGYYPHESFLKNLLKMSFRQLKQLTRHQLMYKQNS